MSFECHVTHYLTRACLCTEKKSGHTRFQNREIDTQQEAPHDCQKQIRDLSSAK